MTFVTTHMSCWSHRPRDVRGGIAAVRFLGLRVRIPPRHGCLSVVTVVCCRVEVSATGRSLIQSSPTEYGASQCDLETSTMSKPRPTGGCRAMKKKYIKYADRINMFSRGRRLIKQQLIILLMLMMMIMIMMATITCESSGSHSGVGEDSILLECDAVKTGQVFTKFYNEGGAFHLEDHCSWTTWSWAYGIYYPSRRRLLFTNRQGVVSHKPVPPGVQLVILVIVVNDLGLLHWCTLSHTVVLETNFNVFHQIFSIPKNVH